MFKNHNMNKFNNKEIHQIKKILKQMIQFSIKTNKLKNKIKIYTQIN